MHSPGKVVPQDVRCHPDCCYHRQLNPHVSSEVLSAGPVLRSMSSPIRIAAPATGPPAIMATTTKNATSHIVNQPSLVTMAYAIGSKTSRSQKYPHESGQRHNSTPDFATVHIAIRSGFRFHCSYLLRFLTTGDELQATQRESVSSPPYRTIRRAPPDNGHYVDELRGQMFRKLVRWRACSSNALRPARCPCSRVR